MLGYVRNTDWTIFHEWKEGPFYAQVIGEDVIFRKESERGPIASMVEVQKWNAVLHSFSTDNVHYENYQTITFPLQELKP